MMLPTEKATIGDEPRIIQRRARVNRDRRFAVPHLVITVLVRCSAGAACPKCSTQMWLARLSPDDAGREWGTFECPTCGLSNIDVVKLLLGESAEDRH